MVGIGPGSAKGMTGEARQALERCQVIAGYTVYADLVRDEFPQKEYLTTPMTREEERCRMAIACCLEGKGYSDDLQRRRRCIRHGRSFA